MQDPVEGADVQIADAEKVSQTRSNRTSETGSPASKIVSTLIITCSMLKADCCFPKLASDLLHCRSAFIRLTGQVTSVAES